MPRGKGSARTAKIREAESYKHPESSSLMRPDVGTQAQFKKRKPPQKYRYDDSLSPALDWDGQNPAREQGEAELAALDTQLASIGTQIPNLKIQAQEAGAIEEPLARAQEAVRKLKALGKPFLNWAGKAERLSFDVPTLPLFVHERLSTKAIIETLTSHKRDRHPGQETMFELFGDPQHSVTDQILRAYEYQDKWVNRMILGDSLVVMNSLLQYEGLGGQVQMIYMDPPYGVKFGSNFQPFVRKRDVSHNDDEDMTREPEMVQAYRDTWELGLHSYLTYLRDRLLLARDLLAPSGSIFVQISDENLHHVRELMDEVMGPESFKGVIPFSKTTGLQSVERLPSELDYLLWFGKDRELTKYRLMFEKKNAIEAGFNHLELPDGSRRPLSREERSGSEALPDGARLFMLDNLTKPGPGAKYEFIFEGGTYTSGKRWWGTPKESLERLVPLRRLAPSGKTLRYVRYFDDFSFSNLTNLWQGFGGAADPIYVVQTNPEIVQRCVLMTTDPGDLVLDPTCGSGTTAYVAEQWGRRWITIDTSRVPLALARQRLLTATFPWYELKDAARGPAGGFQYKRKHNNKGEEVGGIVPHVTLKSIANNEPPEEEVLVDRPERDDHITRVSGPFCVEGTIPTPVEVSAAAERDRSADSGFRSGASGDGESTFTDRMLEILRKSPVLRLAGNSTVTLRNIRPPAKTLSLSAEAMVGGNGTSLSAKAAGGAKRAASQELEISDSKPKPVALVFGPENGAVSEKLVYEAAREAHAKNYTYLYVIGFAIQPSARQLVENCEAVIGIPATYAAATPDLMMGDLLKNMRSSQIFSVCGLPEIKVGPVGAHGHAPVRTHNHASLQYQVELLGLDVFDPVTMETHHRTGNDVTAWFLDTDYNGLCFHVSQAFFPRTSAWDNLKKALKGEYEESVWDHLSGTTSAPFEPGEHRQIAVKVIDDRGNELMVVEKL
jgi:adenine-specific DNA-methyltransferase